MINFASDIERVLNEYELSVSEQMGSELQSIGKEAVSKLKANSPRASGDYAKSWKLKREYTNGNCTAVTVYNKKYQLTHLLEHGHAKRRGGRTPAKPHIGPVQDWASERFEKRVEIIVGGAE